MINLLPEREKEELLIERSRRLLFILEILFLLFLICFSLILFSIRIHIDGEFESQRILVDSEEKEFQFSEYQKLETEVQFLNRNLTNIKSFYQTQPDITGILEKINETLPAELYLNQLSLRRLLSGEYEVSIAGFSPEREGLFKFKKNLESENQFKEIYFPPVNWTEPTDIDFNLTFKVINETE